MVRDLLKSVTLNSVRPHGRPFPPIPTTHSLTRLTFGPVAELNTDDSEIYNRMYSPASGRICFIPPIGERAHLHHHAYSKLANKNHRKALILPQSSATHSTGPM